jgi:hypothetical protein
VQTTSRFFSLLTLLTVFIVLSLYSQSNPAVSTLIADGDKFLTAEQNFNNAKALDKYREAEKIEPQNFETLWRISRAYVDIGEHLPAQTKEQKSAQLEYYQISLDYAEKAIQTNSSAAMGYTRRAIANGRVALFKGVWESIDLVKRVRDDCQKAIELDPNEPTAHYVFGRTHAKLCEKPKIFRWPLGLSWANRDDAAKYYEKSIALRSNFIMYRLDAARNYIEMDQYQKAKDHLYAIPSLPTLDEDDHQYRNEAEELLKEIEDK